MLYAFYASLVALSIFGLYILLKTKRMYKEGKTLSTSLSMGWWILDIAYSLLVISSSLYNLWPLQIDETISVISGLVLLIAGVSLTTAGIIEFRSLRKVSGMDISKLITTGIYSWSRNPQFLGTYLAFLGISLFWRSGYALLLTVIAITCCHFYIVKVEEPYLKQIFGKEYDGYKLRTPRYIKIT
jgi:protein-S-isoprenylcysteine O-methyltransferase Ste14